MDDNSESGILFFVPSNQSPRFGRAITGTTIHRLTGLMEVELRIPNRSYNLHELNPCIFGVFKNKIER